MQHAPTPDTFPLAAFAALLGSEDAESAAGADVLIVVAHPDDETIGVGGHLTRLGETTIVHVTDGAPRDLRDARSHGFSIWQEYAQARRNELVTAMSESGIGADQLLVLGLPDKEAARNLAPFALQLAGFFRERKPRFVCTHPFEGGHPDHDAIAFAVATACRLVARAGLPAPSIVEMAFYHEGADGAVYQDFVPDGSAEVLHLQLDAAALERKRRMLDRFVTQRRVLASFDSTVERFRIAPQHDFLQLPNGGRLLYERLQLGLTGTEWLTLAQQATAVRDTEGG